MGNKSAWQRYKDNLGDTRPWDVINPNIEMASGELADSRYATCKQCPELIKLTKQCKKCGCFMEAKTKLARAVCPIGRW
jgi:hypothetical protein